MSETETEAAAVPGPVEGSTGAPGAAVDELAFDVTGLPGGALAALEAVLVVADEPIPAVRLASVLALPTAEVERLLTQLAEEYRGNGSTRPRGFELRQVGDGWRIYTAPALADVVGRFVTDGQSARLTQAALETLAVIAYRQPVTRGQVSAVRGVNVDGVVRTLAARGLVAEIGTDLEWCRSVRHHGILLGADGARVARRPPRSPRTFPTWTPSTESTT